MKITKPESYLYHKYPTQLQPQPTYIELDPEAETLRADWDSEIGNAVPVAVWHGRICRYTLPSAYLRAEAIAWFMDEIAPYAQRVCDGYSGRWDGSNYVGELDDDAREAEEVIYRILDDQMDDEGDCIQVWEAADWYQHEHAAWVARLAEGMTDEELRSALKEGAGEIDVLEEVDRFVKHLREEYEDSLDIQ